MRFVFVSTMTGAPWGGSEELWSRTALRLREMGHEVAVSVKWWPTTPPNIVHLARYGVIVRFRKSRRGLSFRRVWEKTGRILGLTDVESQWLRDQRPDLVIISQGAASDGIEWLKFCKDTGLPFVAISHCNAEGWWPEDSTASLMADSYSAARKVFCVSRANLKLLEMQIGVSLSSATVVRNPFNVSPDQPVAWPVEDGVWRLACVARLDPVAKGQDLLFEVLARPAWRDRAVEVNLYGTGSHEQGLRRLAAFLQLNSVRFHGHLDDVKKIWADNHLLVLPSRYEGLPLSLVESMWCGRPAVVTDVGGNGELCANGETGFVAAAPTADLLAEAMEAAWAKRTEWSQMGKNARSRVEQIIPKDPVEGFCRELITCASAPAAQLPAANATSGR